MADTICQISDKEQMKLNKSPNEQMIGSVYFLDGGNCGKKRKKRGLFTNL